MKLHIEREDTDTGRREKKMWSVLKQKKKD